MLDPYNFFFDLPLYTSVEIDATNMQKFANLMAKTDRIDGYHPLLKENTTYAIQVGFGGNSNRRFELSNYHGSTDIKLTCVRSRFTITYYVWLSIFEEDNKDDRYFFQKVVWQNLHLFHAHLSIAVQNFRNRWSMR